MHAVRTLLVTSPRLTVLYLSQLLFHAALFHNPISRMVGLQSHAICNMFPLVDLKFSSPRAKEVGRVPSFLIQIVLVVAKIFEVYLMAILVGHDVVVVTSKPCSQTLIRGCS